MPRLHNDFEELLRLMKRGRGKDIEEGCLICGEDHSHLDCLCLYETPAGVEIDRDYDEVCLGFGRIGVRCCSKGAYAVHKNCDACGGYGHWYWENLCRDGAYKDITVPSMHMEELEEKIMKNKDQVKDDGFIIYYDFDESVNDEDDDKDPQTTEQSLDNSIVFSDG